MNFSAKQKEFLKEANHRWNVKCGATRSGKTYLDYFIIPKRIREVAQMNGLNVIMGNTKTTIQRNIIEPLQSIWGTRLVSDIKSDNTAMLFGEKVHCIGAGKVSQVDVLRGSSIKYCYGDEIVTWHEDVFNMLKSRLDRSYSKFDGTCNPEGPNHWFKKFLDSDADIFQQSYSLDDNPFLDERVKKSIKKEYAGTVYYNRYVDGLWVAAEGCVYPLFANNATRFILDGNKSIQYAIIGVDFGGTKSAHSFTCVGFTAGFKEVIVLDEFYHDNTNSRRLSPAQIEAAFVEFVKKCKSKWKIYEVRCDSAEQTLIEGLTVAAIRARLGVEIKNAIKGDINDRIRLFNSLMGTDRFKVNRHCTATIKALQEALYKPNQLKDTRLDDGSLNVDSLDSMEYAVEPVMKNIIFAGGFKK